MVKYFALSIKSLNRKRRKRLEAPFYYSSQTMHCLNKLNTARKHQKNSVECTEKELKILVDMDKQVLLSSVQKFKTNEAFAMLKNLNGRSFLPKKMFYRNEDSLEGSVRANLFNQFFQSVFQPKTEIWLTDFVCGNEIKLSDVQFSLDKIQNYLLSVPSSSTPAFDGRPPTILSKAAHTLASFVHLVFTYIIHSQIWPENRKCAYVIPIMPIIPLCYQLIKRDIRVFTAILNNENCISFEKFFKLDSKVLNLRIFDCECLALTRAKKRYTEKSFFFRV